jgi:hypothetical protein
MKRYLAGKRIIMHCMDMFKDSIMKATKHCLSKEGIKGSMRI